MASLVPDDDEPEEQLYLLEVIINDVDVIREGILETLAEEPFSVKDIDGPKQEAEGNEPNEAQTQSEGGAKQGDQPSESKEVTAKRAKKKINTKAPLRVLVRFFDFPTIEVPENEFGTEDQPKDCGPVKGKTCLFPMVPKQMMEVIRKHSVEIQVRRDSKRGPARIIGMTRFSLGQEFIDAVALANTPTMLPVSTFVEGEYDASNVFGEVTASVHLLLRLSCFGSTIFSHFKNIKHDKGYRFAEGYLDSGANNGGTKKSKPRVYLSPSIPREVDLGLQVGSMQQECHKNPSDIPWRKLHEDPVDPRVCGPKRLFKEQRSKKEDSVRREDIPWLQTGSALERSLCPGGICCGGRASSSGALVPPEFGNRLPNSIKQLLPSQRRTSYQIPLNTGHSNFETECSTEPHQTYACSGQTYSSQLKTQCEGVCSGKMACGRLCPGGNCVANTATQPPSLGGSSNRKGQKEFPLLEESSPPLKSAPPAKADIPSSLGALRRDMEYIPCPNNPDIRPANTGNVECGLGALIDQRKQNVHNLLQPTLMAPKCPPDAMGKRRPSLCTCPKVPTVIFEPPGGVIRCECSNILASLKPVELPYTCPPQEPQPPKDGGGTCPPCPPVPIRLPPPQPECPLVKLLKEAQNENLPPAARGRLAEAPNMAEQLPENKQLKKAEELEKQPDVEGCKTNDVDPEDQGSKSREKIEKPPKVLEKGQKKSKEGVNKILREEVSKASMPFASGDHSEVGKRSIGSKASTAPGSEIGRDESPTKKKKMGKKIVDQGRGSATPTHLMEPQERELRIHYTPTAGLYPGFVIGHRNCIPIIPRVPKRMGWLWNVKDADGFLKPGRGWRPGSIQTNVMKVMDNAKTTGKQSSKSSTTGKIQGIVKTRSGDQHPKKVETNRQFTAKDGDAPTSLPMDLIPTLHVHKKHGLHYVSMVPPPKDRAQKGNKPKHHDRGDTGDTSTGSEDDLPAQFRIDTKNPDGLPSDPNLYETEETSSYSEDSYQMEIVAPSSLRHRQPQPRTQDTEVQVTEDNFVQLAVEGKGSRKKSNVSKNSTLSHKGGKGKKHARVSLKKK